MKAADEIIDIGPEAGTFGGQVVASGSYQDILVSDSLTAKYLNGSWKLKSQKTEDIINIRWI